MRKILTFLCAALMSVGMWAKVTPKGTDVWDDATKTLTVKSNPVSNAYINVSDIENLVISDAVTSIGDNAFENCNSLKSVVFGSSLASIGEKAFASCIKLESVTFPASLESIGKSAFSQCDGLTSVTITNGLTSIGQQAFYNCEKLATVTIPNSVASIGMNAFGNCDGLTEIVVAAENPNYSSADGVLFDKDKTTLIQCPGGKQGEYTIPNSVTSIGNNAFSSCYLLTSVEIPNSVGEIGSEAFSSCIGLTSVTIGNGIAKIGGYAFYYSSKLASVTINATTPPTLGSEVLGKTAAALKIYVPAASVTDYKGAWTAYADKIEAISGGEPAEVTVVFAANDKTVERTVTLPHTFKCDWAGGMERPDELDIIIHELYNDYYYCNSNMNASGSDQVEAGTEVDPKNDYITIKGVFEGTATVTGDYLDYIAGDYGEHNYSITISIKGDEPEPEPESETLETNKGDAAYNGAHFSVTPNPGQEGDSKGFWVTYTDHATISALNGETIIAVELTVGDGEDFIPYFGVSEGEVSYSGSLITITDVNASSIELLMTYVSALQISQVKIYYTEATAVSYQQSAISSQKIIRDGQIMIIKGDKTYNVQGTIVR